MMSTYREEVNAYKKRLIEERLRAFGGHRRRTAASLGIARENLYRLIRTLGVNTGVREWRP